MKPLFLSVFLLFGISPCLFSKDTYSKNKTSNLPSVLEFISAFEKSPYLLSLDTQRVQTFNKFPGYRYYINNFYFKKLQRDQLDSYASFLQEEKRITETLSSQNFPTEGKIRLQVVFHLLQGGEKEKLMEELQFQMEALNRDFNQLNLPEKDNRDPEGKFRSLAAVPNMEFVLADVPENLIPGVSKITSTGEIWENYDEMKNPDTGSVPVDPSRFINIWVVRMGENLASYATRPGADLGRDGIVLEEDYFGRGKQKGYDQGKTLTHLMANYLGLHDLWSLNRCLDDGVSDTPIHNSPTWEIPGPNHISTCGDSPRAMTMNFMDNSPDEWLYMFTRGQVQRLRYMLSPEGPRFHLTQN